MKKIPDDIMRRVDVTIADFNEENRCSYCYRVRGLCIYLYRDEGDGSCPICRMKFKGKMDNWEFSIYKYSTDKYDPEEIFFPGAEYVDGTIEGALNAGLEAYPS